MTFAKFAIQRDHMKKFIIGATLLFAVLAVLCIGVGLGFDRGKIDNAYINEVLRSLEAGGQPSEKKYDYTLFDSSGNVLYSSVEVPDMSYDGRVSRAICDGDVLVDYGENKVVFYVGAEESFKVMRNTFIIFISIAIVIVALFFSICSYHLYARTVKPFGKLKDFADEIAKGNLDMPLRLDRYNSFGAFGEAFDIMRNNLKENRLAEQRAAVEKRKLMQEIGHELKTPLASIKAVAEYGQAATGDDSFDVILDKANAIDSLVNDFYHITLEEEGRLDIYLTRHSSGDLAKLIAACDYNGRCKITACEECFLLYDKLRMSQVIDNIIANSYKYADTDMAVDMNLKDGRLRVRIRDSGEGVLPEQLSFVMDRFYRGSKTQEKLGQGLGLHICRKLIMRMGGELRCFNDDGFVVEITLPVLERNS